MDVKGPYKYLLIKCIMKIMKFCNENDAKQFVFVMVIRYINMVVHASKGRLLLNHVFRPAIDMCVVCMFCFVLHGQPASFFKCTLTFVRRKMIG